MFYARVKKIFCTEHIVCNCGDRVFFHKWNVLVCGAMEYYVAMRMTDYVVGVGAVNHITYNRNDCCLFADAF